MPRRPAAADLPQTGQAELSPGLNDRQRDQCDGDEPGGSSPSVHGGEQRAQCADDEQPCDGREDELTVADQGKGMSLALVSAIAGIKVLRC